MRVFSRSIETFLERLSVRARRILREDFRVRTGSRRFRTADGWTWPILLVAIDDPQRLGYFDARDCTIGIHKRLMYSAKDRVLDDLLRHELAHYFAYIEHHVSGLDERPHGPQFQSVCDRYGLGAEVRSASIDVASENDAIEGELRNEAVLARFQRLMSLAESDNEHEASLAVLRANELMVKHNLDAAAAAGMTPGEVEFCVRVVIPAKRSSPRIAAISAILEEFLVFPVQGRDGLEVTGTRANVEQAEYVAAYLNRALAAAWKAAKQKSPKRKLREKPFMEAASNAYLEKLRSAKAALPAADQKALIVLNDELEWAGQGAYGGGLRSKTTRYETCADSTRKGAKAGAALELRRGVTAKGVVPLIG